MLSVSAGRSTPYYYKADGVMEAYIRIGNESVIAPSYGFLAKRANGSVANSPYVNISREYMKQANNMSVASSSYPHPKVSTILLPACSYTAL